MSKIKIHIFDPVIYPRKLFVINGYCSKSVLSDAFCNYEKEDLLIDEVDKDMAGACTWANVIQKDSGMCGVLVLINRDKSIKSLSHEAVHVVNSMFKDIGVDVGYEHDEHYAYMLGWVVDCLNQVVTGKFKDK